VQHETIFANSDGLKISRYAVEYNEGVGIMFRADDFLDPVITEQSNKRAHIYEVFCFDCVSSDYEKFAAKGVIFRVQIWENDHEYHLHKDYSLENSDMNIGGRQ
jgi:hypothetical protein